MSEVSRAYRDLLEILRNWNEEEQSVDSPDRVQQAQPHHSLQPELERKVDSFASPELETA